MSFVRVLSLKCDGEECEAAFEKYGVSGRQELLDQAALAGWLFYARSHFCVHCRKKVEAIGCKS